MLSAEAEIRSNVSSCFCVCIHSHICMYTHTQVDTVGFFSVQKILEQLIISEQYSIGEPEVSTENDGNARKGSMEGFRRAGRTEVLRSYPVTLGGVN